MVLAVKTVNLRIGYLDEEEEKIQWAVRGVDLEIQEGESFCLVGESGSGKTTLANAIAGILPPHAVTQGKVYIFDKLVVDDSSRNYNGVRGRIVNYIPQNPGTSLNPFLTIEDHFYYVLRDLYKYDKSKSKSIAIESLSKVGLTSEILDYYPHELSGGMKQRVLIALALASNARIIVADEPTSSVDASLRAGILGLLSKLNKEYRVTLIIVTHDIKMTSVICNRTAVMYSGEIVEIGKTSIILQSPKHPYTRMLMECVPILGVEKPLKPLPGEPTRIFEDISWCSFRERCPYASVECKTTPSMIPVGDDESHFVKCWRFHEVA